MATIHNLHIAPLVISGKHLAAVATLVGGLVLMPAVTGCGGTGRVPVSGKVTLDGQPLEHGLINFRPSQGNAGPGSGGVVNEGRFEIPADKGLRPGSYKVSITALKKNRSHDTGLSRRTGKTRAGARPDQRGR